MERSFPSFTERRVKNDAVMVPDKGFTKQLKCLDKDYEVVWNWGQDYWEIWKFPSDGRKAHYVTKVTVKGKTYRELGADVLLRLEEARRMNDLPLNTVINYLNELDDQEQRRSEKNFRARINAIARETFDMVRGVVKIQVPRKFKIGRVVSNG